MNRLRAVPAAAWVTGIGSVLVVLMLLYLAYGLYTLSRPTIMATSPSFRHPTPVCPGELMVIEYRAMKLRPGNQNLISISNWYNPETRTRYAGAPSTFGAIFPEGTTVLRSLTEVRVPQSLPPGPNEYWRAILGQPGSLFRVYVDVLPRDACPSTELNP